MRNKQINLIIICVVVAIVTVFVTIQYQNWHSENIKVKDCYLDNNLTKTLTLNQFTENINALIQQNAPTEDLADYINCYEKDSDGNFSLKLLK